jgi:hypothetical protein
MKGIYNKNSKLDFGMYKGYDLGIVYVFDPSYINWCINNIDRFHISDLNELKELGVINQKLDWQYKMIGDPSLIPNIDIFGTFQELIENIDLGNKKYTFSDETLEKNSNKSGISYLEQYDDDYYDQDDYEDSGGYDYYEDDQSTWGQKQDLCDLVDICYGCPHANKCF